jgi:hypothetical protein
MGTCTGRADVAVAVAAGFLRMCYSSPGLSGLDGSREGFKRIRYGV